MKNIHVGLGYSEAIEGKKNLLSCEADILESLKKIKSYKILRQREFVLKNKLKQEFGFLRKEIEGILSVLPADREIRISKIERRTSETKKEKEHDEDIEKELLEIREKLERLG